MLINYRHSEQSDEIHAAGETITVDCDSDSSAIGIGIRGFLLVCARRGPRCPAFIISKLTHT